MSKKHTIIETVGKKVSETVINLLNQNADTTSRAMTNIHINSALLTAFNAGELEGLRKAESIFKSLSKE